MLGSFYRRVTTPLPPALPAKRKVKVSRGPRQLENLLEGRQQPLKSQQHKVHAHQLFVYLMHVCMNWLGRVPWVHTRNVPHFGVPGVSWYCFGLLGQSLVPPQTVPLGTDEPCTIKPRGWDRSKKCQGAQPAPSPPLPHKWSPTSFPFPGFTKSWDWKLMKRELRQ